MRLSPSYIRKALMGIALCCVAATSWAQETLPYWKDIQTVGVNREPTELNFWQAKHSEYYLVMV